LPPGLQKEIVEKAAARYGNCQELARHLDIPKSSVHYYRVGRLTMPQSVLDRMLEIAGDEDLRERVADRGITKDRTWANEYAVSIYREMCRERVRLPTREELEKNDGLRRKAAAIISYVMAEGSVWLQKEKWGECAVNITLAEHETDLYEHFRGLCRDVFDYDIGPPQKPGNGARAIRGFIYSRFIAEWLIENGVKPGNKSSGAMCLPSWITSSQDERTWISALQPWCDGEGCVTLHGNGRRVSFSIAQSRHTDLSCQEIPERHANPSDRGIGLTTLRGLADDGLNPLSYCEDRFPSEILREIRQLFERLGIHPTMRLTRLHLKDDGFWSAIWVLRFGTFETEALLKRNLIIGERKRRKAMGLAPLKSN